MVALDNFGGLVPLAYFLNDFGDVPTAFGQEYDIGALEMAYRFAQNATRQQFAVSEGIGGIHQNNFNRMFQSLILKTVIKYQRITAEALYRISSGLDPVAIDDYRNPGKVGRQHIWLIAAYR